MTGSDLQLLEEFTRNESQDAFTALVRRHLDLVYCAASRQVRSSELAKEVAQSVFLDLARNASRLKSDTILSAWLYQVTRRTAIDAVRREARRRFREQIASDMNTMNANVSDWTKVEPLLDEAMDALTVADRTAVLLRYFDNKSLREVGQSLGVTDEAARKRINRAIDHLRKYFTKRGATFGTSALAVIISANAVQSAPPDLGAAIATGAFVAWRVGSTAIATKTSLTIINWMNAKTLTAIAAATLTAGSITYLVEQRQASDLRIRNQSLLAEQQKLIRERDAALSTAATDNEELDRLRKDSHELLRLRGQVSGLRQTENENNRLKSEMKSLDARRQTESVVTGHKEPVPNISGISFKGASVFPESELEKILDFKVGEPVDDEKIQQNVLKIQKMYVDAGYGAILVRAGVLTDKKLGESSITFQIGEDSLK